MDIHVARDGQQLGSYNLNQLNVALSVGEIMMTDLAWSDGEPEWIVLSDFAAKKGLSLRPNHPVLPPLNPPPRVANALPEESFSATPPPSLTTTEAPPKVDVAPAPPPPPVITDAWFVIRADQEYGPYTKEMIKKYIAAGNMSVDEQIRHENGSDRKSLGSILEKPSVDLNAMAVRAGDAISGLAGMSATMATKAIEGAGPLGQQVKNATKGKEKVIFGGLGIAGLALLIWVLVPGGPSAGDIRQAMQRQFSEKGVGVEARTEPGGEMKLSFEVLGVKKIGCKSADSGGYYCQYEIDTEAQIMGNSTKQHETNSGRFVKGPSGWAIVGG